MNALESELASLIIDALELDDDLPADFTAESDLFETLGLDSVDALELSMAIRRKYGVSFDAEDQRNKTVFASLKNLADFVRAHQASA